MNPCLASRRSLPSLRVLVLTGMLSVLILPLGAIHAFRLFENELVRQTEQELLAQSAVLDATLRQMLSPTDTRVGFFPDNATGDTWFDPVVPRLDLGAPIAPPRPEAQPTLNAALSPLTSVIPAMTAIMATTQQRTLAGMRLLDRQGTVLVGREERGLSLAHIPEVAKALRGNYASMLRTRISTSADPPIWSISRGTDIRVFTAFPVLRDGEVLGVIYLSRTPLSILKRIYEVRFEIAAMGLVILVPTLLLGLLVSAAIARPIRDLLRQVDLVHAGKSLTVAPIARPVSREMAQLSEGFAAMSQALDERGDYIRRFVSHLSHELKTPLTAMRGALELLREHDMTPEQRQRFLRNLMADTERMRSLVLRLLELAKADALNPTQGCCTLREGLLAARGRFHDLGLDIATPDDTPILPLPHEALDLVLSNLCQNSLEHGATQVEILPRDNGRTLLVRDNGHGISPANRDKVFTPFFTTRRTNGGTGLGLEICRSVLRAHGGDIALGKHAPGATFIITFADRGAQPTARHGHRHGHPGQNVVAND